MVPESAVRIGPTQHWATIGDVVRIVKTWAFGDLSIRRGGIGKGLILSHVVTRSKTAWPTGGFSVLLQFSDST